MELCAQCLWTILLRRMMFWSQHKHFPGEGGSCGVATVSFGAPLDLKSFLKARWSCILLGDGKDFLFCALTTTFVPNGKITYSCCFVTYQRIDSRTVLPNLEHA